MKLLLCLDCFEQLNDFLSNGKDSVDISNGNIIVFKYKEHEVTVLKTGFYKPEVFTNLIPLLSVNRFHLAIKISYGISLQKESLASLLVNIVNEKDIESKIWDTDGPKSLYEAGVIDNQKHPHIRGGFVNMNNSYMNVFLPYKKVVGVSPSDFNKPIDDELVNSKASVSTLNGLAFAYCCLFFKQNYYHLAYICNNVNFATKQEFPDLSKQFIEIIDKL